MKIPMICCPRCDGGGKVKLDQALIDTLAVMGKQWQSTAEIYDKLQNGYFKITAINNRLTKLLELGFIEVEVRGKPKYWRLK